MRPIRPAAFCALLLLSSTAVAQATVAQVSGQLFEDVVRVLGKDYFDRGYRRDELPVLAARYREAAHAAGSRRAERAVVADLLTQIPISHLALYSRATHDRLMRELDRESAPTLGCQLVRIGEGFFIRNVLEGGPAERAGLQHGDRVVLLDGEPVAGHPRLDWRSDDAHLVDSALHALRCRSGERVELTVERHPGEQRDLVVDIEDYSAWEAARESVAVVEAGGLTFGYVHFWYVHYRGLPRLLRDAMRAVFADCDALVLDLRGRGGSGDQVFEILDELERWRRPAVVLTDHATRSAKEVLAWEIRRRRLATLIGERTAGAVIPASFAAVGDDAVLMYPATSLDKYTEAIEGVGVAPDVYAAAPGPYSAGRDPILQAAVETLVAELTIPPVPLP